VIAKANEILSDFLNSGKEIARIKFADTIKRGNLDYLAKLIRDISKRDGLRINASVRKGQLLLIKQD
jgi:hypothetical protein